MKMNQSFFTKYSSFVAIVGLLLNPLAITAVPNYGNKANVPSVVFAGDNADLCDDNIIINNAEIRSVLCDLIKEILHTEQVNTKLCSMYLRLKKGEVCFPKNELQAIAPNIIDCITALQQDRSPRPGDMVVGPGGCDNTLIIQLLLEILSELDLCCTSQVSVTACCQEIINTLTSLQVTATTDLSGVYTSLTDIKDTLTACCFAIESDLAGVFTVLDDLQVSCTADVDLSGVYTSIADLKDTVTECCTDLKGIFTVLDNLVVTATVDFTVVLTTLVETVTACCADVQITVTTAESNIINTFTACCNDILVTVSNIENTIIDTVTACCADVQTTVTVAETNIINTLTACCTDLKGIFTVLDDLQVSCTADLDLSGVYTSIADLKDTVTECCTDLKGIFTVLDNLMVTATVDLTAVLTTLDDLTTYNCNVTFITQEAVDAGPGYVINTSGVYKLAEDLTYSSTAANPAITINSDNVVLLCDCFVISNVGNGSAGIRVIDGSENVDIRDAHIEDFSIGILVEGLNRESSIVNAEIIGSTQVGIWLADVGQPIFNLRLENIYISSDFFGLSVGQTGTALFIENAQGVSLQDVVLTRNSSIDGNVNVISLNNCTQSVFDNVRIVDNGGAILNGILINSGGSLLFNQCNVISLAGTNTTNGFIAEDGGAVNNVICNNCLMTQLSSQNDAVRGYYIGVSDSAFEFNNCQATSIISSGTSLIATAHGFNLNNCIDVACNDCQAANYDVNFTTTDLGAIGFDLNNVTLCKLFSCKAFGGQTSSNTIGIRLVDGSSSLPNHIRNCTVQQNDVGILLSPDSTTDHIFIQNVSTKNGNNFVGFPSGSEISLADISLLSTVSAPWINLAVG